MSNKSTDVVPANYVWHMPGRAQEIIASWAVKSKSPYSHSYYDCAAKELDWGHKPVGSLRISDHWNFYAKRDELKDVAYKQVHCPTDQILPSERWVMARWDGERYVVIEIFDRVRLVDVSDAVAKRMKPALQRQREKNLAALENNC